MAFKKFLCPGKAKLGIEAENIKVFLEDGTEIDEDETMLACDNGTVFVFVPDGEEWEMQPSDTTGEKTAAKGGLVTDSKGDLNLSFVKNHHILQNFKKKHWLIDAFNFEFVEQHIPVSEYFTKLYNRFNS